VPRPEHPANGADPNLVPASGATESPWLGILARSAAAAGAVALVLAAAAFLATSPEAGLSVLFGAVLVMAFFGISLLIGHFTGRTNPSGALGLFIVTYAIKVVGFAAVLFLLGTPDWLDRTWFFTGALATVLVWQAAEVFAFSRLRTPLYAGTGAATDSAAADRSLPPTEPSTEPPTGPSAQPSGQAPARPTAGRSSGDPSDLTEGR
jgi:ATP synthase protein I